MTKSALNLNKPVSKMKRAKKRQVNEGRAYISVSYSNTIIMVSDSKGSALTIASAGSCGYRGGKKATAYAAQQVVNKVVNKVVNDYGLKKLNIFVKGIGPGRDSALRAFLNTNLHIESISDRTTIAHGGVRPRKARRI